MHWRTLGIVALLALTSVAAETPEPRPSSAPPSCAPNTPCSDPEFRECLREGNNTARAEEECKAEYCERHSNDWCKKWKCRDGTQAADCKPNCLARAEQQPAKEECKEYCREHEEECRRFCANHPEYRMCSVKPKQDPRHITFHPQPDGLVELKVNGRLVLVSVRMDAGETKSKWEKNSLVIRSDDARLELHDDASGFLRFKGDDLTLEFPTGIQRQEMAGSDNGPPGFRIRYADGGVAFLKTPHAEWLDDQTVVVEEFMSFHIAAGQGPVQRPGFEDAGKADQYRKALEGNKVGAEIRVRPGQDHEVLAFDDVDVRLKAPRDRPTRDDPLVVTFSAELAAGRSFVLHLDRALLDVREDQVHLRYFDLPEGENSTVRREVVFRPASSLQDILDANDDDGQPEYYVVRDAQGLQVIVTVPHWSVHMVELSALAEILPPSVLFGVLAGAAGAALAAVAMFVPRRK